MEEIGKLELENEKIKEDLMDSQERLINFSDFQQKFKVFHFIGYFIKFVKRKPCKLWRTPKKRSSKN